MTRAARTRPLPTAATPPAGSKPAPRNGQSRKQLPVTLPIEGAVLAPVLTAIGRDDGPMAYALVRSWLIGQGYPPNVELAINITASVTVSKAKEETRNGG